MPKPKTEQDGFEGELALTPEELGARRPSLRPLWRALVVLVLLVGGFEAYQTVAQPWFEEQDTRRRLETLWPKWFASWQDYERCVLGEGGTESFGSAALARASVSDARFFEILSHCGATWKFRWVKWDRHGRFGSPLIKEAERLQTLMHTLRKAPHRVGPEELLSYCKSLALRHEKLMSLGQKVGAVEPGWEPIDCGPWWDESPSPSWVQLPHPWGRQRSLRTSWSPRGEGGLLNLMGLSHHGREVSSDSMLVRALNADDGARGWFETVSGESWTLLAKEKAVTDDVHVYGEAFAYEKGELWTVRGPRVEEKGKTELGRLNQGVWEPVAVLPQRFAPSHIKVLGSLGAVILVGRASLKHERKSFRRRLVAMALKVDVKTGKVQRTELAHHTWRTPRLVSARVDDDGAVAALVEFYSKDTLTKLVRLPADWESSERFEHEFVGRVAGVCSSGANVRVQGTREALESADGGRHWEVKPASVPKGPHTWSVLGMACRGSKAARLVESFSDDRRSGERRLELCEGATCEVLWRWSHKYDETESAGLSWGQGPLRVVRVRPEMAVVWECPGEPGACEQALRLWRRDGAKVDASGAVRVGGEFFDVSERLPRWF